MSVPVHGNNDLSSRSSHRGILRFLGLSAIVIPFFIAMTVIHTYIILDYNPDRADWTHFVIPVFAGLLTTFFLFRETAFTVTGESHSEKFSEIDHPWNFWPLYARYIVLSTLIILPFAIIQQIYILELDTTQITVSIFFIPFLVAFILGSFLANQSRLKVIVREKLQLVSRQDQELKEMNENLERLAGERAENLLRERKLSRSILDMQPGIVILTDGLEMKDANLSFFRTFSDFQNLEDFHEKHRCLCELFTDAPEWLRSGNPGWVKRIADHPEENYQVSIFFTGEEHFFDLKARPVNSGSGELFVLTLTDITPLVEARNHLQVQAYTDSLTGLYNRLKLQEDCIEQENGLILINVDGFQEINNFFGNQTGDRVLIELAKNIQNITSDSGVRFPLYRVGGDDFAVLLPAGITGPQVEKLCKSLHDGVRHRALEGLMDTRVSLSITLGVVLPGSSLPGGINLLNGADLALKSARENGIGIEYFHRIAEKHMEYEKNIQRARMLKDAVNTNSIVPVFQPILNLANDRIEKFECLARIRGKGGAMISPGSFLKAARTTRMYHHITRSMFRQTIDLFRNRTESFSINITVDDIVNDETVHQILELLTESGMGPRCIIEIVETQNIENFQLVSDFLNVMRGVGCQIAIDDFGSGYSNYEYVLKLDVDFLKIDASLVRNLDSDIHSHLIVRSILDFARSLSIKTVAEFVHSRDVFDSVRRIGFDFAQGFFIGEPGELPSSARSPSLRGEIP